uniref:Uncharacterized protein n=1 Tax=Molossus molossus TaxID=27622 RepID=A0A7J8I9D6_MOLMO|nr:hypothetical protein HJG59_010713 [Molossus molossus]
MTSWIRDDLLTCSSDVPAGAVSDGLSGHGAPTDHGPCTVLQDWALSAPPERLQEDPAASQCQMEEAGCPARHLGLHPSPLLHGLPSAQACRLRFSWAGWKGGSPACAWRGPLRIRGQATDGQRALRLVLKDSGKGQSPRRPSFGWCAWSRTPHR